MAWSPLIRSVIQAGPLRIDTTTRKTTLGEKEVNLSPREYHLLELLARSSEHQQIILMTTDDRVRQWARLESMAGHLGVVEPSSANIDSDIKAISLR